MSTNENTYDNPGPGDGPETTQEKQADHGSPGPEGIPGQQETSAGEPTDPDHGNLGPEHEDGNYPQPGEHQSNLGRQD